MLVFTTGDDCEGDFYPKLENPNFESALPGMEKFEAVIPGISKIDPTRGSSSILSSLVAYMTYSYIQSFFYSVCTADDINTSPGLKDFSKFCKVYDEIGCLGSNSYKRICMISTLSYYEMEMVVNQCSYNPINMVSLSNRVELGSTSTWLDSLLSYIEFFLFLALVGSNIYFSIWHENYCRKLSNQNASMGEFSLLLTGIPYGAEYNDKDLKGNIKKMFLDLGYKLKMINFVYDIDEYRQLQEEFSEKIYAYRSRKFKEEGESKELATIFQPKDNQENEGLIDKDEQEASEVYRRMINIEQQFQHEDTSLMVGKAFISFETIEIREKFYEKYQTKGYLFSLIDFLKGDFMTLKLGDQSFYLSVENAGEPQDIVWENLKYTEKSKFMRRLLSYAVCFILIIIGFFITYYLNTSNVKT